MRKRGPGVAELQEQIFNREGFRVAFERLGGAETPVPAYDYPVMAPNGWRVSDWKRIRLAPYVLLFRDVKVFRGDGAPLARDVKLGHLRDTYYQEQYGTLAPEPSDNLVSLEEHRATRRKR